MTDLIVCQNVTNGETLNYRNFDFPDYVKRFGRKTSLECSSTQTNEAALVISPATIFAESCTV